MKHPRLHHLAALVLLAACSKSPTSVAVVDVASVEITPASPSIEVGVSLQFTAEAFDINGAAVSGQSITWASSASSIAGIDTDGLATGLVPGSTQITATVGGVTSSPQTLTVTASTCTVRTDVTLSPGEYASFPGDECLLLPAGAVGDYYRVAVGRPTLLSEDTTNVATVSLSISPVVVTAAAAGPDRAPSRPVAVARIDDGLPLIDGTRALEHLRMMDATRAFEMRLRMRERQLALDPALALASRPAAAPPALADPPATTSMYVALDCSATLKRPVTLIAFNDNLVIYEMTSEYSTDPISQAAADKMLEYFDLYVKDMVTAYWGPIPDTDANQRIIVVTTNALDESAAAAVFSGDYFPTSSCGGSNEGEVIYFKGDLIRNLDAADPDAFALGVLAHEAKHVISLYNGIQRGSLLNPEFNDLWIEEGTADLSAEMSSRIAWAATGGPAVNAPITRTAILLAVQANGNQATDEMTAVIDDLAGIVRSLSSQPNSVMNDPVGAPDEHSFYNMSWHWHRVLGDGFGDAASAPLADSSFFRLLTDPLTPAGGAAGELQITGSGSFDDLFEDFVVAVSLQGSGFTAPHPIETWDFVSAGDVFTTPNPDGSYPWPVTAKETRDASGRTTSVTQYAPFGSDVYSGSVGPSGVRFHDFRSNGTVSAQIQVSGADDGVIIVTRLD